MGESTVAEIRRSMAAIGVSLKGEAKPTPEDVAGDRELPEVINGVLDTLSYREREIIKLRYGLGDGRCYTLEEIGHIFKVTRERIRSVEAKAIRKLQNPRRSELLVEFLE